VHCHYYGIHARVGTVLRFLAFRSGVIFTNVLLFHFVNAVPNTLYLSALVNVALPCHQNVVMLTNDGM